MARFVILRHRVKRAVHGWGRLGASDSAHRDGSSFDAESADESAAIVGVVGEAAGVPADFLGEHVDVLDAPVRGAAAVVVGKDLGAPPVDRASQSCQLGHVGLGEML